MIKRKKEKRISDNIGKIQFNFDFQHEADIYSYLYGIRMSRKAKKTLEERFKFCCYSDWMKYIQNKYINYDYKKLIDFKKYLYQKIKNQKPISEYWKVCVPILLSVIISQMIEMVKKIQNVEYFEISILFTIICLVIIFVIIIPILYITYKLINELWENNTEENMLVDYIEVIESMIEEKQIRNKKKAKREKKK